MVCFFFQAHNVLWLARAQEQRQTCTCPRPLDNSPLLALYFLHTDAYAPAIFCRLIFAPIPVLSVSSYYSLIFYALWLVFKTVESAVQVDEGERYKEDVMLTCIIQPYANEVYNSRTRKRGRHFVACPDFFSPHADQAAWWHVLDKEGWGVMIFGIMIVSQVSALPSRDRWKKGHGWMYRTGTGVRGWSRNMDKECVACLWSVIERWTV